MDGELTEKLKKIRILALDVDGVLTNGQAFYGTDGFEGLFFNVQDGSGIKYLQRHGVKIGIITGRSVEAVNSRARVLEIDLLYQGAKVKVEAYDRLKQDSGFDDEQIAFVGDDLTDIPVLRRVGLPLAVANARPDVKDVAQYVTQTPGGEGAVREIAEMILKAQGSWQKVLSRYFDD